MARRDKDTARRSPILNGIERGSTGLHAEDRWFRYATFKGSRNPRAESGVAVPHGSGRSLTKTRARRTGIELAHGADGRSTTILPAMPLVALR